MIIKCLMMCKNEADLLIPWVNYHGFLFGFENLYVFDNGSTDEKALAALDVAEKLGVYIDRSCTTAEDFIRKGDILADFIRELDATAPADFYFPVDCDEFIGVEDLHGAPHFDRASIERALKPYLKYRGALMISAVFTNIAGYPTRFSREAMHSKTFFARRACVYLDNGFHFGRGVKARKRQNTPIINVHYHYKPYELLVEHSRQKLSIYTDDFSPEGLQLYMDRQMPCHHVAQHLLRDKESYYKGFEFHPYINLDELDIAFARADVTRPFNEI